MRLVCAWGVSHVDRTRHMENFGQIAYDQVFKY